MLCIYIVDWCFLLYYPENLSIKFLSKKYCFYYKDETFLAWFLPFCKDSHSSWYFEITLKLSCNSEDVFTDVFGALAGSWYIFIVALIVSKIYFV